MRDTGKPCAAIILQQAIGQINSLRLAAGYLIDMHRACACLFAIRHAWDTALRITHAVQGLAPLASAR